MRLLFHNIAPNVEDHPAKFQTLDNVMTLLVAIDLLSGGLTCP
jgi:hypothetical protein